MISRFFRPDDYCYAHARYKCSGCDAAMRDYIPKEITYDRNTMMYTVWDETWSEPVVTTEHLHEALAAFKAYCKQIERGNNDV